MTAQVTKNACQVVPSCPAAELGESPVWDERSQRLYWTDITQQRLHWIEGNEPLALSLPGRVGFVALTDDPATVIAGVGNSLYEVRPLRGEQRLLGYRATEAAVRCNDGKPDPTGRLWWGTVRDGDQAGSGSLYSCGRHVNFEQRLTGLGCSNGLAWNVERLEMYFIDSLAHRIDRYGWDPQSGHLSAHEVLAQFTPADGLPDGMCIDAADTLWVAFWGGSCVRQFEPVSGRELSRLELPVSQVTSCTFGGPELRTLYITTARIGLSDAERAAQPLAGRMFQVELDAPGRASDRVEGPLPSLL